MSSSESALISFACASSNVFAIAAPCLGSTSANTSRSAGMNWSALGTLAGAAARELDADGSAAVGRAGARGSVGCCACGLVRSRTATP